MRKLFNNPIFVAALSAAALAMLTYTLLDSPEKKRDSYLSDNIAMPMVQLEDARIIDTSAIASLAEEKMQRNPFAKLQAVANTLEMGTQGLQLTIRVMATWVQEGIRCASLDGLILREGQEHKNIVVEKIEADGVLMSLGEQKRFVRPGESWTYQYIE